jgi:hypothetical protein
MPDPAPNSSSPFVRRTEYHDDGRGRTVEVADGAGSVRYTTYDAAGNPDPRPGRIGPDSEPPDEPFLTGG